MEGLSLIYYQGDLEKFREWIRLNMDGVTWQGRFGQDFEEFWNVFFIEGLSLKQFMHRFSYVSENSKIGPLQSWFGWLRDKFLCFTFVHKNIPLYELSLEAGVSVSFLATILRNFFLEVFPHLDEYFSERFQVGNVSGPNLYVSFQDLKEEKDLNPNFYGSQDDEIMPSMEITLYEEWSHVLKKMKKELYHPGFNFQRIKSNASIGGQLKFLAEVVILILIGFGAIYGVQRFNLWYEKYLVNKIKVYEPQYKWLDKTLKFKSVAQQSTKTFKLEKEDLEKVDEVEAEKENLPDPTNLEEERFETESEVFLTSWDSLPRNFGVADLEHSEYEEFKKSGNRDTRFGNKKVFRVMMKSVAPEKSRESLNSLLEQYQVTQVDNVRPGQDVPGGLYYNVFVPRIYLREFLAQVMAVDESILYETRTRGANPPGKNRVFIWIKNI